MPLRKAPRSTPERYFLGFALLVPVAVVALLATQVPSIGVASASSAGHDGSARLLSQRPAPSNAPPPPTLTPPPPTATPIPTTPAASSSPTPSAATTYVVAPGDELKTIAAEHHLTLAQLLAANRIPDPDSLQVGQPLRIPAIR